ncbi:MAG: sulfide/dihydroorotate dehydrogenase-like FAD/NAD-binding protein [Candidatus Tectomicrobia bacterium]|nr:sulfide/dihydroorotate dehydrogenase-like FAD/NAD-binding protein [Candidatus Tectomicrobia bacterium]
MIQTRYEVVRRREIAPKTVHLAVRAPEIARKYRPGQFVIVRTHEHGERVPLSLAGSDMEEGLIYLLVQAVGKTSGEIHDLAVGDAFLDVVGPLGRPTPIAEYGTCVLIGGGFGVGALQPIATALRDAGNRVIAILGARQRSLVLLEEETRALCDEVYVTTDDGSHGRKGIVTDVLREIIERAPVHFVMAVGPMLMMKAVSELTRPHRIRTLVSLNTIMVDGTGMCGSCRVVVGGQTRFACVHGPDFDGHLVDFEAIRQRNAMYLAEEREALERRRAEMEESCQVAALAGQTATARQSSTPKES